MHARSMVALTVLAGLALLASSSLYVVKETQTGIRLQFGKIVETDIGAGLHVKIPVYNTVRLFDTRVQTLDTRPSRYLTGDRKGVIVDSFVKWRIVDVTRFYQATSGDQQIAANLIAPRVDQALRNEFGRRSLQEIVSEQRDELMAEPMINLNRALTDEMGISVIDMRIKRIELPTEVTASVYERMRSERQREAREYRAQGQEEGERIRARADRAREILLAEAQRDSEIMRGEGDAIATRTYAEAFGQDPEFFSFLRSTQAYQAAFNSPDDLIVVSPRSEFFRFLDNSSGRQ